MSKFRAPPVTPAGEPAPGAQAVRAQAGDIGRIVHYVATDPAEQVNGAEVCAAVITRVLSPDRLNLRLLPDGPVPEQWMRSIAREHSFVPVDGLPSRFWRWPPLV